MFPRFAQCSCSFCVRSPTVRESRPVGIACAWASDSELSETKIHAASRDKSRRAKSILIISGGKKILSARK